MIATIAARWSLRSLRRYGNRMLSDRCDRCNCDRRGRKIPISAMVAIVKSTVLRSLRSLRSFGNHWSGKEAIVVLRSFGNQALRNCGALWSGRWKHENLVSNRLTWAKLPLQKLFIIYYLKMKDYWTVIIWPLSTCLIPNLYVKNKTKQKKWFLDDK